MDTVYVKPAEGARIRQPERGGRVMPAAGDRVVRDGYYERLILSGDVVVSDPPSPAEEPDALPEPTPSETTNDPAEPEPSRMTRDAR